MCGGGKAARRAAEAAAQEQARQAEIERARLAEEARIAREEAERRYLEEQARNDARFAQQQADAEALRKQIADQEAFRLSELSRIESERKTERDADLARQNAERAAAEAAAQKRADDLARYNAGRQTIVDQARNSIEKAFGVYDDGFYDTYATDYINAMKPQIARQYDDAKRGTTFDFARRGNLKSTAAARQFGRLDETRADAEANIAQEAASNAMKLRSSVDAQRANLLNGVFGAVNAAPVVTGDNIGNVDSQLAYLSGAVQAPISAASSFQLAAPSPTQLGNIFANPNAQKAAPRTGPSASNPAPLTSSGGGSGRLVN